MSDDFAYHLGDSPDSLIGESPSPAYKVRTASQLSRQRLWADFCSQHRVAEACVPLFAEEDGWVLTRPMGQNGRPVLQRSTAMEAAVRQAVAPVVEDFRAGTELYDGLLYIMFWLSGTEVHPLYIGKAEKYGRTRNLSANIAGVLRGETSMFCRWGNGYAYHIGDLSAVVCDHLDHKTTKYRRWADRMFAHYPSPRPRLRRSVYFWMAPWARGSVGPWVEYGETQLTFAEYLLIGLAGAVHPDKLLNESGINRGTES